MQVARPQIWVPTEFHVTGTLLALAFFCAMVVLLPHSRTLCAHALAGWLSGDIYEKIADKIYLIQLEVAKREISIPEISEGFTKNDYVRMASQKLGMDGSTLDNFLWTNYHPSNILFIYSGVALSAVVLLWVYDRFILGK